MSFLSPKRSKKRGSFSKKLVNNGVDLPSLMSSGDDSSRRSSLGGGSSSTSRYHDRNNEVHSEPQCMAILREFCRTSKIAMSDDQIFRYACFHSFHVGKAKGAIEDSCYMQRFLQLKMSSRLEQKFASRTVFPLPGLKAKNNKTNVVYMRPSRYFPESNDTNIIIDSLCYVLNDLSATEENCRNGVAVVANMKGWTIENFSLDYWALLMQTLQGQMVPTKIELFLIVNPPSWFGNIWKIMKPMLTYAFSKNVHIINQEDRLSDYLKKGYEKYMPDEICQEGSITEELVEDYVDKKSYEDRHLKKTSSLQAPQQ